jgi:hypothetical protein
MAGFQNLLDLCDHLQSPAIETCVLGAIKARMDRREYPIDFDPWGIFALAARRDNVALASARSDVSIAQISIFETSSSENHLPFTTTFHQDTSMLCFDAHSTPTPRIRPGSRISGTAFVLRL